MKTFRQYLKENKKSINERYDKQSYKKQCDGEFVEIYNQETDNLIAIFEGNYNGTFTGSDYAFDSEDEDREISDGYKISGKIEAKDLFDMLEHLFETYGFLTNEATVGYDEFKEKYIYLK